MNVLRRVLGDVVLLEPRVFADDRGLFFESFNASDFARTTGFAGTFVQDNHSVSRQGVVRGLHYQLPPFEQGKLVRVVAGSAFDVAVDIRRASPTFGQWVGETLTAENRRQLWIPPGFAHGFMALEDRTEFLYKTTSPYHQPSERSIAWNDSDIAIVWPRAVDPLVSPRDAAAPSLAAAEIVS